MRLIDSNFTEYTFAGKGRKHAVSKSPLSENTRKFTALYQKLRDLRPKKILFPHSILIIE